MLGRTHGQTARRDTQLYGNTLKEALGEPWSRMKTLQFQRFSSSGDMPLASQRRDREFDYSGKDTEKAETQDWATQVYFHFHLQFLESSYMWYCRSMVISSKEDRFCRVGSAEAKRQIEFTGQACPALPGVLDLILRKWLQGWGCPIPGDCTLGLGSSKL